MTTLQKGLWGLGSSLGTALSLWTLKATTRRKLTPGRQWLSQRKMELPPGRKTNRQCSYIWKFHQMTSMKETGMRIHLYVLFVWLVDFFVCLFFALRCPFSIVSEAMLSVKAKDIHTDIFLFLFFHYSQKLHCSSFTCHGDLRHSIPGKTILSAPASRLAPQLSNFHSEFWNCQEYGHLNQLVT